MESGAPRIKSKTTNSMESDAGVEETGEKNPLFASIGDY
jgi:hypothetical protein